MSVANPNNKFWLLAPTSQLQCLHKTLRIYFKCWNILQSKHINNNVSRISNSFVQNLQN